MGCEIYWEPKGIFRRYFGHVTGPEMTEPVIAMQADPRFDGVRYVILDLLDVETFSVTQADLKLIGALDTAAVHSNPRLWAGHRGNESGDRRHGRPVRGCRGWRFPDGGLLDGGRSPKLGQHTGCPLAGHDHLSGHARRP